MKQLFETREDWLMALVSELRPLFEQAGLPLQVSLRCSCGWPSRSVRKILGQCWQSSASEDGTHEIFVTPALADGFEVASVMVHECLHAALPDGTGHRAPFRRGMRALGLEGPAKATHPDRELAERLHAIVDRLGAYPHARLNLAEVGVKKQGTRMLKLVCPACGYAVRTTAKWIEVGLPSCPCGMAMELV
jgi:hypothetical protein